MGAFLRLGYKMDSEPVIRRSRVRILSPLPDYQKAPFWLPFCFSGYGPRLVLVTRWTGNGRVNPAPITRVV
jgi:hypothetical protein